MPPVTAGWGSARPSAQTRTKFLSACEAWLANAQRIFETVCKLRFSPHLTQVQKHHSLQTTAFMPQIKECLRQGWKQGERKVIK